MSFTNEECSLCIGIFVLSFGGWFLEKKLKFWSYALSKFLHVIYLFPDLHNAGAVKLFCAVNKEWVLEYGGARMA